MTDHLEGAAIKADSLLHTLKDARNGDDEMVDEEMVEKLTQGILADVKHHNDDLAEQDLRD